MYSCTGGYIFKGDMSLDGKPIKINSNIVITCALLKIVAASAADTELGALFVNTKEGQVIGPMLAKIDHPQLLIPMHINHTTDVGIVKKTIKRQWPRFMEMRYFWFLDQASQIYFKF